MFAESTSETGLMHASARKSHRYANVKIPRMTGMERDVGNPGR